MTKNKSPHIGIFGRRNVGKSSLINKLTGQNTAIVSDMAGTTTDPVKKSVEIFGIGPTVIIDTAGIDDVGDIGKQRIQKSIQIISQIDFALLLISENTWGEYEEELIARFVDYNIPYLIIHNKTDIVNISEEIEHRVLKYVDTEIISFSSINGYSTDELVQFIKNSMPPSAYIDNSLLADIVNTDDVVLLVTPVDTAAPEGRMILPQVQAIRDALDNDCMCIVIKEDRIESTLRKLAVPPSIVITDTQVIDKVTKLIPEHIPTTGFSVLFAHYKGEFEQYLKGTPQILQLNDGDRVLLLESCTHQITCDDIGRIKIPAWIRDKTNKKIEFDVIAGLDELQRDVKDYSLVIQCGGCMITRKQIKNRLKPFIDAGIPVTNYGMSISWLHGVYDRCVQPFV